MQDIALTDGAHITRLEDFASTVVAARHVDVWCPPNQAGPFAVLYMHDGQNLFEPAWSYGGVDWGAHQSLQRLMQQNAIPPTMVVGVWNSPTRWRDYMPEAPFKALPPETQQAFVQQAGGPPHSDAYLNFLVQELKPFIDNNFPTRPQREHTFVAGSSMGALVSLYALCQHPKVFAAAGCVSTHWPIGGEALVDAFAPKLPTAGQHRLYFDYGTTTLDALYEPFQQRMDANLARLGFVQDHGVVSKKFEGAAHNEASWRERLDEVLSFVVAGRRF